MGSPPRVRGKVCSAAPRCTSLRITPACAGKSRHRRRSPARVKDHPRVCGEKELCALAGMAEAGSPPRVRGKALLFYHLIANVGITPACAGKRMLRRCSRARRRDHPRVCGEKDRGEAVAYYAMGSPPRVRGKGPRRGRRLLRDGITPACAGKRTAARPSPTTRWDHPRVCGEKLTQIRGHVLDVGSPPRVRGKDRFQAALCGRRRITPACAGKRKL